MPSFDITADLGAFDLGIDQISEEVQAAARPAAQAGAQVLYDQVKLNVASLGRVTGNLASAIYQAYSEQRSGDGKAEYAVSWNARKAPHGHLVEAGYIQRYQVRMGKNGRFFTLVRSEAQGKPKPGRRASQAAKDAYYVPLPAPRQVAGKAFVRSAMSQFPRAFEAMQAELYKRIGQP